MERRRDEERSYEQSAPGLILGAPLDKSANSREREAVARGSTVALELSWPSLFDETFFPIMNRERSRSVSDSVLRQLPTAPGTRPLRRAAVHQDPSGRKNR